MEVDFQNGFFFLPLCLRFLTEVDQAEYRELERSVAEAPDQRLAQKRLASWLTQFIHGDEGLEIAVRASEIFFGAEIANQSDERLSAIFPDVPSALATAAELQQGLPLIDALVRVGLAKSKSDARRTLEQGGAYVNNRRIDGVDYALTQKDLASETIVVMRSGKKKFALLRIA